MINASLGRVIFRQKKRRDLSKSQKNPPFNAILSDNILNVALASFLIDVCHINEILFKINSNNNKLLWQQLK